MVVQAVGIFHLNQQEIGIAGPDFQNAGISGEGLREPPALGNQLADKGLPGLFQGLQGQFLGGLGNIIRVLHPVHQLDDIGIGKGHSQPEARQAIGLGEGLQNHQVGVLQHLGAKAAEGAEISVGFVQYHHSGEVLYQREDLFGGEGIAGRVVGGAEEKEPGVGIRSAQQVLNRQEKVFPEGHAAKLDVVHLGCHAIHSVAGHDGHGIVLPRGAENAIHQVYGLVAAVPEENVLCRKAFQGRYPGFEGFLPGVRVAVVAQSFVGTFIGIQEHIRAAFRLVPGGGIGGEVADIGPHPLFNLIHIT